MKSQKLITALLLMLPAAAWAIPADPPSVPEPSILPLLAAGGIVAVGVKFMKRKR